MSSAIDLVDRLVSEQHIRDYEANGCVRIAGAFDADTCARLTRAIDAALQDFDTPAFKSRATGARHQNPPSLHRGDGQAQLRNFAQHVDVMRDWLHHSIAGELVARLMRSRSVRFWMDAIFVKDGSSAESATPWHNDECTFPFRGEMMPSFWVALTDVTMDNAPIVTLRSRAHSLEPSRTTRYPNRCAQRYLALPRGGRAAHPPENHPRLVTAHRARSRSSHCAHHALAR